MNFKTFSVLIAIFGFSSCAPIDEKSENEDFAQFLVESLIKMKEIGIPVFELTKNIVTTLTYNIQQDVKTLSEKLEKLKISEEANESLINLKDNLLKFSDNLTSIHNGTLKKSPESAAETFSDLVESVCEMISSSGDLVKEGIKLNEIFPNIPIALETFLNYLIADIHNFIPNYIFNRISSQKGYENLADLVDDVAEISKQIGLSKTPSGLSIADFWYNGL